MHALCQKDNPTTMSLKSLFKELSNDMRNKVGASAVADFDVFQIHGSPVCMECP